MFLEGIFEAGFVVAESQVLGQQAQTLICSSQAIMSESNIVVVLPDPPSDNQASDKQTTSAESNAEQGKEKNMPVIWTGISRGMRS